MQMSTNRGGPVMKYACIYIYIYTYIYIRNINAQPPSIYICIKYICVGIYIYIYIYMSDNDGSNEYVSRQQPVIS